jgi:transcriptional regulator GlxA family with amidase domain
MDNFRRMKKSTAVYYGQLLNKIDEYIILNAESSFGIQQLADACCVSKNHLSDVFRSVYKTSLGNYLTTRKVERAAALCYYTDLNLDEIAGRTGW